MLSDHLLCQILVECGTRAHLLQLILRHQPLLPEASTACGLKHIPLLFRGVLSILSDGGLRLLYR
jgi:hypothetical protein